MVTLNRFDFGDNVVDELANRGSVELPISGACLIHRIDHRIIEPHGCIVQLNIVYMEWW